MASSVAASLRALASASTSASLTKPTAATPSPFLVLLAPTPPRLLRLRLGSTRRLPLVPLAASDSFESSVGVDYAEPAADSEQEEEGFASGDEEEDAVEASAAVQEEEEVGEYVEPPEEAKVYVGNLPYDVDSERLAQLFEQAGVVEVAEVIYNRETDQSRGFGFVTMSTIEEAEKAVEMFHRYDVNGRLLTMFSEHGKVVDARVVYDRETGRSRGFGFVTMATQDELDDAIAALDGQSLDGRTLRVNVAEERPPRRGF
ncbi:unnamed protein product [Urochloa decumbens]|uniref:RRM domain-containing protein n=1 Tax=Urochloa decumbens TaxID=240449 RepID=A0ABC9FR76_9POAL